MVILLGIEAFFILKDTKTIKNAKQGLDVNKTIQTSTNPENDVKEEQPTEENTIKETCIEISNRYEIEFIEIGTEGDHVHFLVQSVSKYAPTQIVTIIKSIIAREVFKKNPEVKKKLWGGEFWTDGYYISTVGMHGNETVIKYYVKNQGKEKDYKQLHYQKPRTQMTLF